MKKLSILLLILLGVMPSFAREITGKVIGENDSPIDFVNVVVYQASTYLTGGITDTDGNFSIPTENNGNLTIKIASMGYEPYTSQVPSSGDMGTIRLTPQPSNSEK